MCPLIQLALQAIGPGATLQDDNATPHRARVVTDVLQDQGIPGMDWPAWCPHLTPMEHVWDVLGRRMAEPPYPPPHTHTPVDVPVSSRMSSKTSPQQTLGDTVLSMLERCIECLAAKRIHTRYRLCHEREARP